MRFRSGGLARRVTMLAAACLAAPALAAQAPVAAQAGAAVTVASWSQWGPDGYLRDYHVTGEVLNGGTTDSKPYNATTIRVTATNALGQAVHTSDAEARILGPGQRAPFDIATSIPCTGCTLSVSFAPTGDPPNRKFSVPAPSVSTDLNGTQHITGTITNNNTVPADYVNLVLTFYNGPTGTGTVVDEEHQHLLNNPSAALNPGESATYEVIRTLDHPAYVSLKAFADSPTPPSLPVLTATPSPFDFGNVHLGEAPASVMTITNTGNDDLHITSLSLTGANASEFGMTHSLDGCTGTTVAPTGTCTVSLTFTPAGIGTRSASLAVSDDTANNPDSIVIQGTGLAPVIQSANLSLGDTPEGRTAHQAVVVTNAGNADLHIDTGNTRVPAGTDFTADASGCSAAVPAGQTCNIQVSFAPTATGPESTTLTIVASASDHALQSPKQVTISGTGTNPTLGVSPAQLSFGSETIGSPSASKTVTVSNSGSGNMHVTGASVTSHPGDYAISGCSGSAATVAEGSSCALSIVFTAQAAGDRGDTLTVTTDAINSPGTVSLLGRGSGAGAQPDKTSLAFGSVNVGHTSATQRVTLTNSGDEDLTISAITTSGDFSQTNDCGSLPAILPKNGGVCHAFASFSPTIAGSRTGTLSFVDNAGNSTHQDVALSGTGVDMSSGWMSLGGSLASSPASASWGPGRLDVFAKGQNGALYHTWTSNGSGWTFWTNLGGNLSSNPAATSWGPNRIDVFARGQDLMLYHMWSTDGTTFNSWQPLGGSLSSDPTAASWGNGRLDVFARGQDLALYHMYTTDGTNWTSWQSLGGTLSSSAAAVSWGANRIDVFARGQDLALYHMTSRDGVAFTNWQLLGGSLASDPAASSWGSGRLDVFAKGQDGALYHMSSNDGASFSGWESLGGSLSSNPAAASPERGRIDLFARGQDLVLYHMILTIV